jgi:hypothetical protein
MQKSPSNVDWLSFHASASFVLAGLSSHVGPSSVRPASRLLHAAPLFEEEWNFGSQALTPDISDPFLHDRSCAWTLLEFTTISIILAV